MAQSVPQKIQNIYSHYKFHLDFLKALQSVIELIIFSFKKSKKCYFFPVRCDFWLSIYFMSWWEGRLVQKTKIAISRLLLNELR